MQSTQLNDLEAIGKELFKNSTAHRTYLYIEAEQKYLHLDSGNLYSEEELDYYDAEERAWKESQPNYSFYDLLAMYGPQCFQAAKRGLKIKIDECNADLDKADEIRDWWYKNVINKARWQDKWYWTAVCDQIYCAPHEQGREATIKRCRFYLSHIKREIAKIKGKELPAGDPNKITDEDVARAKEVPIESLYTGKLRKLGGRATGVCPFHNEKTGSFTIYLKQNKWYCYGCHAGADVIDFVMKQQNIDFLSAVKVLINRV